MPNSLPRTGAKREYRGVYARVVRRGSQPTHIAEFITGKFGLTARFGTALCGVKVSDYPESGEQGKPENAACDKCQGKFRKLEG